MQNTQEFNLNLLEPLCKLVSQRKVDDSFENVFKFVTNFIPGNIVSIIMLYQSECLITEEVLYCEGTANGVNNIINNIYTQKFLSKKNPQKPTYFDKLKRDRKPFIIKDTYKNKFYEDSIRKQYGIRSVLVYPLVWRYNHKIALVFQSKKPNTYNNSHIKILTQISSPLSYSIESYFIYSKMKHIYTSLGKIFKERTLQLQILYKLAQKLSYSLDYIEIFKLLLLYLYKILPYDIAGIFLFLESESYLFIKKSRPIEKNIINDFKNEIITKFCKRTGKKVEIQNIQEKILTTTDYKKSPPLLDKSLISLITVPLYENKNIIGFIFVGSSDKNVYSKEQYKILYTLANQAELSISRLKYLIKTEEKKLESIIEDIPVGLILLDKNYKILMLNRNSKKILTSLPHTLKGNKLITLGNINISNLAKSIKKPGSELTIEYELNPQVIYPRVFEIIISKPEIKNPNLSLIIILHDITEIRRRKKEMQLQSKLAAIGKLAGGIAHDFNNILTSILSYAEFLLSETNKSSLCYEPLQMILHQAKRGSALIKQILDFSRVSVSQCIEVSSKSFIKENLKLLRRIVPENIEIKHKISPNLWNINVDPVQFQEVLMNLTSNSVDAMPEGGVIYIKAENCIIDEETAKKFTPLKPGEYVKIIFEDTGKGISEKVLPYIFEPFFTTKQKGTGLGLSQVYGIIKKHSGYIFAESQINKFTRFILLFPPLKKKAQKVTPHIDTVTHIKKDKHTLLLIEDELFVRKPIKLLLEKLGFIVIVATSGEEGIKIYKKEKNKIDVVISDMVMPGMSGADVFRELKKINPNVKVIIMSGYSLENEINELKQQGLNYYLTKPVNAKDIYKILCKLLS